jgi:hypothetical protein
MATVVLAGCASVDAGEPRSTGADVGTAVASGEPIPDAGSIKGAVVDDSTTPLPGATVAIVNLGLQLQTDDAGSFSFINIPPGKHTLNALKLGYMSTAKVVEVLANEATTGAILTLTPIPVVEPYVETFGPFAGYFECHIGSVFITSCAGDTINPTLDRIVFPNNKRFMFYTLSADNWETQWGEARWSPAAVGSASGMAVYPSYSKRYDDGNTGHWYCEADGNSPIWFRYDADPARSICNSQGDDDPPAVMATNPLMMVADPGFAQPPGEVVPRVLIQQKFEVIMTIFYGEPAPADFTAFPDA